MSDAISDKFGIMVPHGELEECISYLEDGLKKIETTSYHGIMGRDFLGQTNELAKWLVDYCEKAAAANVALEALYLEMNGFAINTDQWHCDLFGYLNAGDIWELEWLCNYDAAHSECFVLTGMEDVQEVYAENATIEEQPLALAIAEEINEHLVTARFMQLVAAAHDAAKKENAALSKIQVLATAHDWDVVHKTE